MFSLLLSWEMFTVYHTPLHLQSAFYLAKYFHRSVEIRESFYLEKKTSINPETVQDLSKANSDQEYLL